MVYVAEGEKDVDALREHGLTATTNSGGAGKWRVEYSEQLRAAGAESVVIFPDNDEAGERHALSVAGFCRTAGLRVKIVKLPGLPPKGDVSDFFNSGHTEGELEEMARTTAEMTQAELKKAKDDGRPTPPPRDPLSRLVKDLCPAVKESVPEHLVLPAGYSIHANQIWIGEGDERKLLTNTPVFIVGKKLRLDDGCSFIRVVTLVEDGNVTSLEDDATLFFEQKKIVTLRRRGIDTNSIQARDLVEYFVAFERQNRILPTFVTESFGLKQQNERIAYLLGSGPPIGDLPISFQSKFDEELCQAFEPRGSLERWKEAFQKFRQYDTVLFTVFFSLTPPLQGLGILPFDNCTLHLCSPTSQGKSVTQRITISMLGNPESRRLLGQWQGTFTGTEEHITNFQGLPVFLEDSQQCKPEHRQEIIYGIGNGAFRHRARVWKANEPIAIYRGVLISSGEDTLEEECSATGMLARFIELEGSPFESFDASTGALVDEVRSIIRSNYGHIYPLYIKHLMSLTGPRRDELRGEFEKGRAITRRWPRERASWPGVRRCLQPPRSPVNSWRRPWSLPTWIRLLLLRGYSCGSGTKISWISQQRHGFNFSVGPMRTTPFSSRDSTIKNCLNQEIFAGKSLA